MSGAMYDAWRVRVVGLDGRPYGAGVLVAHDTVLTCAHVVSRAIHALSSRSRPTEAVAIEFATASQLGRLPAFVRDDGWVPVADDRSGDLALLHLDRTVAVGPAVLAPCGPPTRRQVRAFGHPNGEPLGRWASAVITGTAGPTGEWVQLNDPHVGGSRIEPGFSGAGVVDDATGQVVGIVVGSDKQASAKGAWMIAIEAVAARLPPVRSLLVGMTPVHSEPGDAPDPARLDYERAVVDALTALDGIDDRSHRDDLVREVERNLGGPVPFTRKDRSRSDLLNLVVACLDHRTGNALDHLIAAVRSLHDNGPSIQRLLELLAQDPGRRLSGDDVDRLVALIAELPRSLVSHAGTVAFGRMGPGRDVHPNDHAALVLALSQVLGDADQLPPLLLFLQLVGDSPETAPAAVAALREWVALLAARWQIQLDRRRTAQDIEAVPAPVRSYLVVELREDGPAPDRYILSIWLQHESEAGITGLGLEINDDQPLTIDEVPGHVGNHLRRVVSQHLGPIGSLTIEFVLPYWLLMHPVDQFRLILEDRPHTLGATYPVIIRSHDRLRNEAIHHRWRTRWQCLKTHQNDVGPQIARLVRPSSTRPRAVEDELRRDPGGYSEEQPVCLILAAPRRTEGRLLGMINEALNLGMPVLVWCRLNRITEQFIVEMANQMIGRPMAELPAVVQRLRHQAAQPDCVADHPGLHISLLWDDADRLPPKGAFRAPV